MVIYTSNIIYGFSAKNSKPPRGGYTQDTQFSDITPNLRTARLPPTPTPSNSANHAKPSKSARRQDSPLAEIGFQPICPPVPFNPLQPKYPKGLRMYFSRS